MVLKSTSTDVIKAYEYFVGQLETNPINAKDPKNYISYLKEIQISGYQKFEEDSKYHPKTTQLMRKLSDVIFQDTLSDSEDISVMLYSSEIEDRDDILSANKIKDSDKKYIKQLDLTNDSHMDTALSVINIANGHFKDRKDMALVTLYYFLRNNYLRDQLPK